MTSARAVEFASQDPRENVLPAVAHELRQPLSAIESIAYYLSLLDGHNGKLRDQLTRIQQLVEQSNWIMQNGLALADKRRAAPERVSLDELIIPLSNRPGVTEPPFRFRLAPDLPLVHLDPGFGRLLIENLLYFFRQVATEANPAEVRTTAVGDGVGIEISTSVPGYRTLAGLPPGSALSLDCAHRIATMHGGSFLYTIHAESGIRAQVMLP